MIVLCFFIYTKGDLSSRITSLIYWDDVNNVNKKEDLNLSLIKKTMNLKGNVEEKIIWIEYIVRNDRILSHITCVMIIT